jgi:hypothetical protein
LPLGIAGKRDGATGPEQGLEADLKRRRVVCDAGHGGLLELDADDKRRPFALTLGGEDQRKLKAFRILVQVRAYPPRLQRSGRPPITQTPYQA